MSEFDLNLTFNKIHILACMRLLKPDGNGGYVITENWCFDGRCVDNVNIGQTWVSFIHSDAEYSVPSSVVVIRYVKHYEQ